MQQEQSFDIAIIGGGIVGLATAYTISHHFPDIRIVVFEKENELAFHQTGRNSGVIHSGLYYKPGSFKAENCTKGRKMLVDFAQQHNIAHEICGKVIVATRENELAHMERVFQNGLANGIEGLEEIDRDAIKKHEPYCDGIAGLYVPCTGVIDFKQVARKFAELIRNVSTQNKILTGHEVTAIKQQGGCKRIITSRGDFEARFLINCAGLQSDRIAMMDGLRPNVRIVPFRGDYYELAESAKNKVKNLIYPVPDPQFPFLGVHFTRMIDGSVECGPNAVFSFKREGYSKTAMNVKDTWQSLTFPGTCKMFMRHWRYGLAEYYRAFSKRAFLKSLQRLIPSLEMSDIVPGRSGIRAQAVARDGKPVDDFVIEKGDRSLHILNAPSPAATACLAIAETVFHMAQDEFRI